MHFRQALESITERQSVKPTEIVVVKDGILTQKLEDVIADFERNYPELLKIVALEENKGIGEALKIGLLQCSNELVARMDCNDIAHPQRFEKQLKFLEKHQEIAVLGGIIEDFKNVPNDLKQYRNVPEFHKDIRKFAKFRCPMNHPSVMYKKSKVLALGNYPTNFLYLEDYVLWIKMLQAGIKFHNLQEILLYYRFGTGKKVIQKRSGKRYIKALLKLNKYAYKTGFYSVLDYGYYSFLRLSYQLLPSFIRRFLFQTFYRENK